ncbi:MAG: hypothetical protein KC646_15720 [Candidatus Cloacimonetes bacterium]|nr:hypothetical protein [Candidatus Cloacimonadota bacterium]
MLKLVLFISLIQLSSAGDWDVVSKFAGSMNQYFYLSNGRLQTVANEITIRKKRLSQYLGSGNATYNYSTNDLLMNPDIFDNGEVKPFPTLVSELGFTGALGVAKTVYHEMGHAEWDVLIEESETNRDQEFYKLITTKIKPWMEKNLTKVDDKWLALMEWHGYYYGTVISSVLSDWQMTLLLNGVKTDFSFDENLIRSNIRSKKITVEDFGKISHKPLMKNLQDTLEDTYGERCRSFSVDVSNGMYDGMVSLETGSWEDKGFQSEWWDAIWEHMRFNYSIPSSRDDLIYSINSSETDLMEKLAILQHKIWDELQLQESEKNNQEQDSDTDQDFENEEDLDSDKSSNDDEPSFGDF